jgi:hypothetical protein
MGIEAAERPLHLQARRDDDAVHVHRHGVQPQARDDVRDHRRVQRLQALDGRHRELRQPAAHGPRRRQHLQLAEAPKQRVVRDVRHMVQSAPPDQQQSDEQAHHRHDAEVADQRRAPERRANHAVEPHPAQIALEQLQPGIRRELDVIELQRQIPIDTGRQIEFSSSHCRWPFVCA